MSRKQKIELTWIGKENQPKLEPRILLEDAEKSYHVAHRVAENDIFDNLLALKAASLDHVCRFPTCYCRKQTHGRVDGGI